jgi:hypothetical protein
MAIINDDPSVSNKFGASLTDNSRVVIYNRYMFIVQATGVIVHKTFFFVRDYQGNVNKVNTPN